MAERDYMFGDAGKFFEEMGKMMQRLGEKLEPEDLETLYRLYQKLVYVVEGQEHINE